MKRIILNLCLLVLSVSIISSCKTTNNASLPIKGTKYIGEWESIAAENLGNGTYASRYFNLNATDWEVKFTLYLDSTLSMPVFQFRGVGQYEVEGKSTVIKGADNAIFKFSKKYVTLLTDDTNLVQNFGFIACNLTKNIETDISENGCSFLVSNAVCAQEYDILKLENKLLYFGMRPSEGDMCAEERRPTAVFYPLQSIGQ